MSLTYKTKGIILRARDHRGPDRLYTIYTEDYGKIMALATSAKKANSKLAGHLEPLSLSALFLARGQGLHRVAGSRLLDAYRPIKKDLAVLNSAFYCLELIDRMTHDGLADRRLFQLLKNTLDWLARNPNHPFIVQAFTLKSLAILGFSPLLEQPVAWHKVGRFFLSADYPQLVKLKIDSATWQKLCQFIASELNYHLEGTLLSAKFLL